MLEGILELYVKISARKLKIGCKRIFQMDTDPKHISKVVGKWFRDRKS